MLTTIYNTACYLLFWTLILIGTAIIVCNWIIFIKKYILKTTNASWIPLIGGLSISMAFCLPAYKNLNDYSGIPFFLDYGCILGFIHTLIFYLYISLKNILKIIIDKIYILIKKN